MAGRLEGKVALVTGAGSGIGRETALLLAREGAAVAVVDINRETADQTAAEIVAASGRAASIHGDVSTDREAEAIVRASLEALGHLDILVNNAGGVHDRSILEIDEAMVERQIAVNLKSTLYMAKHAITAMIEGGNGGAIVNIGSVSGLRARPDRPVYVATKGAVIALTRSLAIDFARHGIRANCVCPSATETPMLRAYYAEIPNAAEEYRRDLAAIPLQRLAQPLDIAQAVLFLASDEAAYVTGHVLTVDGGSTAGTLTR